MNNILIFEKIWQILEHYKFDIDNKLYSHMICVICNNILIDAYEGFCGCNYCKKCIEKYLNNDIKECPGDSKNCKLEEISLDKVIRSNSANRNVSKLKVKCPLDSCQEVYELIDMCDHLIRCDHKLILCPYNEIGCAVQPMKTEEIKEHLSIEINNHNKLLVGWVLNIKNEIVSVLQEQPNTYSDETLFNLKRSLNWKFAQALASCEAEIDRKQALIEELLTELVDVKTEKYELTLKLKAYDDKKNEEISKLKESLQTKSLQIQELLKLGGNKGEKWSSFITKMSSTKVKQNDEMNKSTSSLDIYSKERIDKDKTMELDKLNEKEIAILENSKFTSNENISIISGDSLSTSTSLKYVAVLNWNLFDIIKIRKKGVVVDSKPFYSLNGEYKMWLDLFSNKCSVSGDPQIRIRYYMGSSSNLDKSCSWPFQGTITITIRDHNNYDNYQYISRKVNVDRPKLNYNFESFIFPYSNLYKSFVLQNNAIIVECLVELLDD